MRRTYKKQFKMNFEGITFDMPPFVDSSIYNYCYEWIKYNKNTCILFNNNNPCEKYYFHEGKLCDESTFYKKVGTRFYE